MEIPMRLIRFISPPFLSSGCYGNRGNEPAKRENEITEARMTFGQLKLESGGG
jgi:hypothetical protein